jgi:hypothetical protein
VFALLVYLNSLRIEWLALSLGIPLRILSGRSLRTAAFRQVGGFEATCLSLAIGSGCPRCLGGGFLCMCRDRRCSTGSIATPFRPIWLRQARDKRGQLRIYSHYRDQGYMTAAIYRSKIRQLIYLLTRRTLVRAGNRDLDGIRHHANRLATISAKYVLRQL